MLISNRFPPFDDELSISYVMRLAFANGFPNETDFLRAFVSTDNGLQHTNDFCLDTKALADKINIMDPIEQLAQTTVIPALWPLLPASMLIIFIFAIIRRGCMFCRTILTSPAIS